MEIPSLRKLSENQIPERLRARINAVLEEDDAYAADELVELGEEILSHLAAVGFAEYLGSTEQKET
ncbi:MAG: hypothetical protein RI909_2198, partial [Bacteroidota bacterium]